MIESCVDGWKVVGLIGGYSGSVDIDGIYYIDSGYMPAVTNERTTHEGVTSR
jgi:hypothetical protein